MSKGRGLYPKYSVVKTDSKTDSKATDARAEYFVLRIDKDARGVACAHDALSSYTKSIRTRKIESLYELADDLDNYIKRMKVSREQ